MGYRLCWHDAFDVPVLDTCRWNVTEGNSAANGELEYYGSNKVYVVNGHLARERGRVFRNGDISMHRDRTADFGFAEQQGGADADEAQQGEPAEIIQVRE